MAITDGSILTAADLNLLPRSFASTAARDAYYAANPSMLVAGVKAVIGSGATYAEYVWSGSAWRQVGGAAWSPLEVAVAAAVTPGFSSVDTGLLLTIANPSTTSVWMVTVDLDVEVVAATAGTIVANLRIQGAEPGSGIRPQVVATTCGGGWVGVRHHISHTWIVTGMTAGARTLDVIVNAVSTAAWRVNAGHSHMVIRQVS